MRSAALRQKIQRCQRDCDGTRRADPNERRSETNRAPMQQQLRPKHGALSAHVNRKSPQPLHHSSISSITHISIPTSAFPHQHYYRHDRNFQSAFQRPTSSRFRLLFSARRYSVDYSFRILEREWQSIAFLIRHIPMYVTGNMRAVHNRITVTRIKIEIEIFFEWCFHFVYMNIPGW